MEPNLVDASEQDRLRKLNEDLAKDQWKAERDSMLATTNHAIQFGVVVLAGLMTINGAALGAVVGLISTNAARLAPITSAMGHTFIFFTVGFLASVLAAGGAYISQLLYAISARKVAFSFSHPYVRRTSQTYSRAAIFFHCSTFGLVIVSIGCLACGLYGLYRALPRLLEPSFAEVGGSRGVRITATSGSNTAARWVCGVSGVDPAVNCFRQYQNQTSIYQSER
jgi:hypothetical protein